MTAPGWVRRGVDPIHRCPTPNGSFGPAGRLGDVWACECGALWRVARRCLACEYRGPGNHIGQCAVGTVWVAAGPGTRLSLATGRAFARLKKSISAAWSWMARS